MEFGTEVTANDTDIKTGAPKTTTTTAAATSHCVGSLTAPTWTTAVAPPSLAFICNLRHGSGSPGNAAQHQRYCSGI
ncbi:hypothetical protein E2C01_017359 [Portunus trituberculatus]|uniref:Uncharacterized protein n=1 Tax=Portunus trituberculatus TaxID=210409 RepID=A0A5B7DT89_PORTR|nr:hypothetical protein [Portunus trituberculatus]